MLWMCYPCVQYPWMDPRHLGTIVISRVTMCQIANRNNEERSSSVRATAAQTGRVWTAGCRGKISSGGTSPHLNLNIGCCHQQKTAINCILTLDCPLK